MIPKLTEFFYCHKSINNRGIKHRGLFSIKTKLPGLPILYERSHNYDCLTRACLVDQ